MQRLSELPLAVLLGAVLAASFGVDSKVLTVLADAELFAVLT